MPMKIWTSSYELHPKQARGLSRHGVLLKVEDARLGVGFADCHPWEELGDDLLERQLKDLKEGVLTRLTERSLFFARIDAMARSERRNLFAGHTIPESHRLVVDLKSCDGGFLARASEEGFHVVKIKVGKDLNDAMTILEQLFEGDNAVAIKLRLDFGGLVSEKAMDLFLSRASDRLRLAIDFIEDPFPYNGHRWGELSKRYHLPFARDRGMEDGLMVGTEAIVIKPAIMNPIPLVGRAAKEGVRVVVTSSLDHPLGQTTAAYGATLAAKNFPGVVDTCGLLSHEVYEANAFSERLGRDGARLLPPAGFGFGFDDELDRLRWTRLV